MAVVFHRTHRDLLTVSGPEAVAWLQGQLSQDVAGLAPGEVTWSFILAPQGKVDGWGRLHRVDDQTVAIDVDTGAGEAWLTRLNRFKLRTKADLDLRPGVAMVAVRGDQPDGSLPAGWPGTVGGDLLDDRAGDDAVAALIASGATELDGDGYQALRIRAGVPAWGAELDADTIPATVGQWAIDASVSFTKGCYTGQELVARIDSRGGNVPRRLVAVTTAGAPLAVGAEIEVDGQVRGIVTSSAVDTAAAAAADAGEPSAISLAYLQRSVEVPATGTVDGRPVEAVRVPVRT